MLRKGNKLHSIFNGSCPKCHNESMYVHKNPYKLSGIFEMHERCSHCGLKYKMEPSFFYGAMYVSYAVSVAFGFAAFVISHGILDMSLMNSFYVIVATIIATSPIILRLSRNIWINFFIHYDAEVSAETDKKKVV